MKKNCLRYPVCASIVGEAGAEVRPQTFCMLALLSKKLMSGMCSAYYSFDSWMSRTNDIELMDRGAKWYANAALRLRDVAAPILASLAYGKIGEQDSITF